MQIDSMLIELESHTKDANVVKEMVLQRLFDDGIITTEQAQYYSENWQVIVIKKGWFERWFNKFRKGTTDGYQFKYVCFEPKLRQPEEIENK